MPRPSQARGGTLHGGHPDGLAVGDVIGRGGASTVHRARYVATGAPVGLKVLDVVHRDVRPANVLLRTVDPVDRVAPVAPVDAVLGAAQLLDDVAPLAPRGRVAGSVPCAAPEVLQAQRLTPATDVYALACSLAELLTGDPRFPRSTAFAVIHAHLIAPSPSLRRPARVAPRAAGRRRRPGAGRAAGGPPRHLHRVRRGGDR